MRRAALSEGRAGMITYLLLILIQWSINGTSINNKTAFRVGFSFRQAADRTAPSREAGFCLLLKCAYSP